MNAPMKARSICLTVYPSFEDFLIYKKKDSNKEGYVKDLCSTFSKYFQLIEEVYGIKEFNDEFLCSPNFSESIQKFAQTFFKYKANSVRGYLSRINIFLRWLSSQKTDEQLKQNIDNALRLLDSHRPKESRYEQEKRKKKEKEKRKKKEEEAKKRKEEETKKRKRSSDLKEASDQKKKSTTVKKTKNEENLDDLLEGLDYDDVDIYTNFDDMFVGDVIVNCDDLHNDLFVLSPEQVQERKELNQLGEILNGQNTLIHNQNALVETHNAQIDFLDKKMDYIIDFLKNNEPSDTDPSIYLNKENQENQNNHNPSNETSYYNLYIGCIPKQRLKKK